MHNFIMAACLVLFSINGVVTAAEDDNFEIEAEGRYQMEADSSTHYILYEPVFMKKALNEACRLGNHTACEDLKNLKRLHEHDFGLSIPFGWDPN